MKQHKSHLLRSHTHDVNMMPYPSLSDSTYALILTLIEDQQFQMGDRLPSETHLAERFGVSRTVIREALVRLASDGLTETRRGAGSFVTRLPSKLLKHHMPISDMSVTLGTYEVRFVLETEAARLAALRRSSADLAIIKDCLNNLRQTLLSNKTAHAQDMDFHRAIMRTTGNLSFVQAFEALSPDITRVMKAGVDVTRSRSGRVVEAMMDEHDEIFDAIRKRDSDRSALSMHWHLSQGRRRLMP